MSLIGLPLIVVAFLATAVIGAGTVLLWHRSGRLRVPVRVIGVLAGQVALVLSVGLVANRSEQFYPSWEALIGRTGTATSTTAHTAGRLDEEVHTGVVPWRADRAAAWQLASAPSLLVPAGYADRPMVSFPVVLSLVTPHGVRPLADTVTVVAAPTPKTTAASLAALSAELGRDLRVTARGWAIVAPIRDVTLALRLIQAEPGRFVAIALIGTGKPPATGLAATVVSTYAEAAAWASAQTSLPLTPAVELPSASIGPGAR
jgi:hypothetical protein